MDIYQKALLSKLVAQAQTGPPSPTGIGRSITGDQLTLALTRKLHILGLPIQTHRFPSPAITGNLLGSLSHTTGLKMANLIALLQSVSRMEPPPGVYPTTKHEAITVLRMLLQDAATHKPQIDPPQTLPKHQTLHPPRPVGGRGATLKSALTSAVNMSVISLYLDNKIGINRLLQILDYLIKKQNIDPRQQPLQNNFMPGTLTPHSASMFPFHALLNKRRRRRAKAKKRAH
jgi:hypothetical protein